MILFTLLFISQITQASEPLVPEQQKQNNNPSLLINNNQIVNNNNQNLKIENKYKQFQNEMEYSFIQHMIKHFNNTLYSVIKNKVLIPYKDSII